MAQTIGQCFHGPLILPLALILCSTFYGVHFMGSLRSEVNDLREELLKLTRLINRTTNQQNDISGANSCV
jgi:hypothetical protein